MNILLLGSKGRLGSCFKFFFEQKKIKIAQCNNKFILNNQKRFENFLKKKNLLKKFNYHKLHRVDRCRFV